VYFPGVPSPDAATLITVGLSEVKENVDIVFQLARAAAVGGIVSGAAGQSVQLSLNPAGTVTIQILQLGGPMLQRRGSAGDGDFVYTNVTPGKYLLTARTGTAPGGRGGPAPSAGPPLFATAVVEVFGDDLSGIALTLRPMLHVSGRVTFSGPVQPPASMLASFGLRLIPTGLGAEVQRTAISATVRPDGTFQFDGIMPGAYRFATSGEPAGWRSKSARLGTRDVFDLPFEVSSTDVTDIEVSLSDQHSQLAGRLTDANGVAATSYFVIAFAVDRAFWLPSSRRLRSVRPDTDGGFRLDDLPPGEYYLAALTEADSTEWQSPAYLDQVIAAAVKVALGDNEKKIQNLRVGR
jgi:hypothetical protein